MKIEKINENSISLVLQSEDLQNRNLKLTDLSYGSDKAKELLIEIIDIAKTQVGFNADAPLAVEADPLNDAVNVALFIIVLTLYDEILAKDFKDIIQMNLMQDIQDSLLTKRGKCHLVLCKCLRTQ